MAEVTRKALRLLVVPDRRVLLSTDGVSLTATSEAGPRPGALVEAQTSSARFTASGELDSELDDIEFGIARSGGPGSCEIRWRHAAEGMRSSDPPSAISEWEFIDRTVTGSKWTRPAAVRLASGRVVVVVVDATNSVTCWRQISTGWASSTVHTGTTATLAAICVLPDGRLLCHYLSGSATTTQIQMAYSGDGGATWTLGNTTCLNSPIASVSSAFERMRSFVLGQDVGLFLWGTGPDTYQFASSDLGATLDVIEAGATGDYGLLCPDVSVRNGVAYVGVLLAIGSPAPSVRPGVYRLMTARSRLSSASYIVCTDDGDPIEWALTVYELALVADDDGTLWLFGHDEAAGGKFEVVIVRSTDGGFTWAKPFKGSANGGGLNVASWGVAAAYMVDLCVIPERGRTMMLHRNVAPTAGHADSLCAAYLGGWSTVALPRDTDYDRMSDTGGWDRVWLPIEKPANLGWTRNAAGAPIETLGTNGLTSTCGAGESQVYEITPVLGATKPGVLWEKQLQVASGTHTMDVRISDGVNGYWVRVEITTTTVQIYDVGALAYIGAATATTAAQNGIAILLCVDAPSGYGVGVGRVRANFRATGNVALSGPKADRQWTAITGSTTLTRFAVATTYQAWGQIAAGVGVATWRWGGTSAGSYVAGGDGLADPARGRQVSDRSSPVHIEKGLRVAMVSGPALVGQTWNHTTAHDYPAEAVDVSNAASPARRWRSTDDGTQQDLVYHIDGGWRAGDLVVLYIGGANIRTAALYRGAGAATKVMDIDLGYTGLDFDRSRDLVTPALSGSTLPWHVREGMIDGATFALSGAVRRRIRHARGGMWPNSAVGEHPKCAFEISGYDAGDPASGTGELWLPNGLFITTLMQSTDTLTLRLPAEVTADGYHELGTVMLGRAVALGVEYGWGRAIQVETSVRLTTLKGGARRARQEAAHRVAYEIPWADGVDQSGLYTATAPQYVSLYTGGPSHGDLPGTLATVQGLLGELGGAKTPGLVCFRVPTQASAPTAAAPVRVLDPAMLVFGRVTTESWRQDNALGEEGTDPGEVIRGGVLRIESEL